MDFTFLTEDQLWGDDALDVMKRYGTKVAPTDLAVLLGGEMTNDSIWGRDHRTFEKDLTCGSWSSSPYTYDRVRIASKYGSSYGWSRMLIRGISARPALPPSEASKVSPRVVNRIAGIRVAEYGEYPQTVADDETSDKLERLHDSKSLRPTGKNYTFDSVDIHDIHTPFKAKSFSEYEMDGKRYIRVQGHPYNDDSRLFIGEQRVEAGKAYWVEVQPIEWFMDKSGWMIAKKCLFAGIQFDTKEEYEGDFSKTFIKHYLDTYFAKEMEPTGRVASREDSKNIENSDMITSKISLLRAVVAPNISKEKGVVNPKMSAEEKKARLNNASKILQSVKIKDITD